MSATPTTITPAAIIAVDGLFAVIRYTTADGRPCRVRVLARHRYLARRQLPTIAASLRRIEMLREMVGTAARYKDGDMVGRLTREIGEYAADAHEMAETIGLTLADVLF